MTSPHTTTSALFNVRSIATYDCTMQAEVMKRLRTNGAAKGGDGEEGGSLSPEEKALLEDSLIVSINGIAQGLKNSG